MNGIPLGERGFPQLEFMNKGKRQIIRLLNRNVIANVTMMKMVQVSCYLSSVLVLGWSIWNLTHSDLTGTQIVFGLLTSTLGPLVFLGIGVLLPLLISGEAAE